MSDIGSIDTNIHDMTKSVKFQPPGTKFDYPPAAMTTLDISSEYFATNAMLSPVMFSTIGVLRNKLRIAKAPDELEELGIDAYNEERGAEGSDEASMDHAFEIGFDPVERPTIETAKFAYSLLVHQAKLGARLFGKDYPPFTFQAALDFLIEREPRVNEKALRASMASTIDAEMKDLGVDLTELHSHEKAAMVRREETQKQALREQRADLIAAFREVGTIDLVEGWSKVPLLTQYKAVHKVHESLLKQLSRKTAMIKTNPGHPKASEMANEAKPLAELIHTLKVEIHSVYKANKQLFDNALELGSIPELPAI